jgi:hypothetical protein
MISVAGVSRRVGRCDCEAHNMIVSSGLTTAKLMSTVSSMLMAKV